MDYEIMMNGNVKIGQIAPEFCATTTMGNISLNDYIPSYLSEKYHFLNKDEAIRKIHQPESPSDIKNSMLKLIYEELFIYMYVVTGNFSGYMVAGKKCNSNRDSD